MAITEKVTFLLNVNAAGVVKEFDKVGRAADRELGKAETKTERLQATFRKVGAGMLGAGTLAGAALFSMARDASSMAETVDKAAVLFGDATDQVIEFAEGAAKSIGIAKDQALAAAADFAVYGKRAGLAGTELAGFSEEAVRAAADMASFNDASIEDTLAAIASGLRGESEPLQRFGVDTRMAALEVSALNAGLIEQGEKLDAAQVPMAVMAAITEQASIQMGNFADTAGSAANQTKTAAAEFQNARLELGEAALPVLKEATTRLAQLLGAFNDLPAPVRSAITQVAVFGTGLLVAGGAVLSMVGRIKDLSGALGSKWTTRIGAATAAVSMLALTVQAFVDSGREDKRRIEAMADAIGELGEQQGVVARIRQIAEESDGLRKIFADLGSEGIDRFAEALASGASDGQLVDLLQDMGVNGEQAIIVVRRLAQEFDGAREALEDMASIDATGALEREIDSLTGRYQDYTTQAGEAADATEDSASAFTTITRVASEAAKSIDDAKSSLDDFIESLIDEDSVRDVALAISDVEVAAYDLVDAYKGVAEAEASGDPGAAARARSDAISAEQELVNAFESALSTAAQEAIQWGVDTGATTDEVRQKFRDSVDDITDSLGELPPEAQIIIGEVESVFDEAELALEAEWDQSALARLEAEISSYIDQLERNHGTFYVTPTFSSSPSGGGSSSGGSSGGESTTGPGTAQFTGDPTTKPRSAPTNFDGGGSSVTIKVPVSLDGRVIAESVAEHSQRLGGLPFRVRNAG